MFEMKILGVRLAASLANCLPDAVRRKCLTAIIGYLGKQHIKMVHCLLDDLAENAFCLAGAMVHVASVSGRSRREMAETGELETLVWAEGIMAEHPELYEMIQQNLSKFNFDGVDTHKFYTLLHCDAIVFFCEKQKVANSIRRIHEFLREVTEDNGGIRNIEISIEGMISHAGMSERLTIR